MPLPVGLPLPIPGHLSGVSLAMAADRRAVLLLMRITELDRVVTVRGTVDQAVTAVLPR